MDGHNLSKCMWRLETHASDIRIMNAARHLGLIVQEINSHCLSKVSRGAFMCYWVSRLAFVQKWKSKLNQDFTRCNLCINVINLVFCISKWTWKPLVKLYLGAVCNRASPMPPVRLFRGPRDFCQHNTVSNAACSIRLIVISVLILCCVAEVLLAFPPP